MCSFKDNKYRLDAVLSILAMQKVYFIQDFENSKKKNKKKKTSNKPYLHLFISSCCCFNWKCNDTFAVTVTLALTVHQA